jgi:hypothetical protein
MKQKLCLLSICMLAAVFSWANETIPNPGEGKKDEMNGIVIHAESKKPLKDVSVTAILVAKKERVVITEEDGGFSFDELKPGTYKFIFEKSGYKRVTKEKVLIKTDETFQMNIEMIEADDFEIMPSPFNVGGVK